MGKKPAADESTGIVNRNRILPPQVDNAVMTFVVAVDVLCNVRVRAVRKE